MKRGNVNNHRLEVVLLVFLLAFGFFMSMNHTFTSFATLQHINPDLSIGLNRDSYKTNEIIDGNLTINFNGPIKLDTNLTIKFGSFRYNKDIGAVFFQLGKTYANTDDETKAINPSDSKILTYSQLGKKLIGFRLPFGVSINSIDMDIFSEVVDGGYPSSLTFDVGDNNEVDWRYLGEKTGLKSEFVKSNTLDLSVTPATTILNDSNTYHCSLIDLPSSRDFEISANYRLFDEVSTGGNITASILSYDSLSDQILGGANKCDLPEPGVSFSFNSCSLKFSEAIEGEFLVCLLNENSEGAYRIAIDFSNSINSFKCGVDSTSCEQQTFFDYFIKVRGANYNVVFTTPIKLSEVNVSTNLFKNSIEQETSSCRIPDGNFCIIPISVSSNSKGKIVLTDLLVDIGGVEYNLFYDLTTIPGVIYELNRKDISNVSMGLSLKPFNFTLQNRSEILEVTLGDDITKSKNINLFEFDSSNLNDEINSIRNDLNITKNNKFLKYFDYDIAQSLLQLSRYESELNLLSNVSLDRVENETEKLRNKINSFKNTLPKSIKETEILKDILIISPNDLSNIVDTNDQTSVYELQNKIDVNVEVTIIKTTLNSGTEISKTLVKKIIKPKENLENVYIYEKIPKSITNDVDNLNFIDDFEVVERDPLLRKKYSNLIKNNNIEFSYVIDGKFIEKALSLKTIIVPLDIETIITQTPQEETHTCGDEICSIPFEDEISCPIDCGGNGFPWLWLIFAIIILLIGVVYFNFYRGKLDFRKLTKGKNPFKNKNDLENIKKFIKNSLNKNIEKKNISKTLLQKKWNKSQIRYAFEDIEWEQKWVLIKIEAPVKGPNVKVIKKYIRRCRKSRMEDINIKKILLQKGWTNDQINDGFKKADSWF